MFGHNTNRMQGRQGGLYTESAGKQERKTGLLYIKK